MDDSSIAIICTTAAELYSQTKCLLMQAGIESDEEEEDSSDDDSVVSGDDSTRCLFSNMVEDITMYTKCLVDLGASLECPAVDHGNVKQPMALIVRQRLAHDYHAELISAKYPTADDELVTCLGKTSWNRYRRMQLERETNSIDENHVSSAVKSQAADSEFIDSGLGSSVPPVPSSYAESTVSFRTDITGGQRVQIPLLSAEAKRGEKFECNACGKNIRVKSSRAWR
jgi:hypothetical protein